MIPRGEILRGETRSGALKARVQAVVVGSGAGGAVVGKELAEAGLDVLILEEGPYSTAADFNQREGDMIPLLFQEGGARATRDLSMPILQGRGVGGSTVHNICLCWRAHPGVLRRWREKHGVDGLEDAEMDRRFTRVERTLFVSQIPPDQLNPNNALFKRGCDALGIPGFVSKHNRVDCVQCGYCGLGCAYNRKQSMLITYVPLALRAGAAVASLARAERVRLGAGGRAAGVSGRFLTPAGEETGTFEIEADVTILAAGAVNSPHLLLQSGLRGAAKQVGRGLRLHPFASVTGVFDEPVVGWRGIPQSYLSDAFVDFEGETGGWFLMPGFAWPMGTAVNTPGFGPEFMETLAEFPRSAVLGVMLHDTSEGTVSAERRSPRPRIDYRLNARDAANLRAGLKKAAEIYFAAGAKKVVLPFAPLRSIRSRDEIALIDRAPIEPHRILMGSVHPQGTLRMGGDPRTSATDSWGELRGAPRLFVADTSLFPTSLGGPPMITAAAMATRLAERLIERRRDYFREGNP